MSDQDRSDGPPAAGAQAIADRRRARSEAAVDAALALIGDAELRAWAADQRERWLRAADMPGEVNVRQLAMIIAAAWNGRCYCPICVVNRVIRHGAVHPLEEAN